MTLIIGLVVLITVLILVARHFITRSAANPPPRPSRRRVTLWLTATGVLLLLSTTYEGVVQPAVRSANTTRTLRCLVKGPPESTLITDPVDIGMAWGVNAAVSGHSTQASSIFTWVLSHTNSSDQRHAYAWSNLRCVQIALAPPVQLALDASTGATTPLLQPTQSVTQWDRAQTSFARPAGNPSLPVGPDQAYYDYQALLTGAADRAYLENNRGVENVATTPNSTTILNTIEEWQQTLAPYAHTDSDIQANLNVANMLKDTLNDFTELGCVLNKQFDQGNCSPIDVEVSEATSYDTAASNETISIIDPDDLVDFRVISRLFDVANNKQVRIYINNVYVGYIDITNQADQHGDFALPPLSTYSYEIRAIFKSNNQQCGCNSVDSGEMEIQEKDLLVITTSVATEAQEYRIVLPYKDERLKLHNSTRDSFGTP